MSRETPEWAQKIEDWGRQVEAKFDRKAPEKQKKPKHERKSEFLGSIFGNFIALLVVNAAPGYFPGFFTDSYPAALWVMNTVLVITIFVTAILLVFSPKWFYLLAQAAMNAISVVSIVVLVSLFPFNIPFGLSTVVRFALTILAVIVAITAIVYLARAIVALIEEIFN